jgi:hypothetical protein
MYLIQVSESGLLPLIPPAVPAEIQEQIAGAMSSVTAPGYRMTPSRSPIEPPIVSQSSANLAVPSTRKSLPRLPGPETEDISGAWDVTPVEKFDADQQFDILDPHKNGIVEGDVVAKYMLRFQLQPDDLAHIWLVKAVFSHGSL